MASLHRHSSGRSPFWWVSFTGPDGRQIFRSTKQKQHTDALKVALKWEKAAKMAREGNLTEVQSRKVLNDILEEVGQPIMSLVKTAEFLQEWIASKTITKAKGTALRYQHTVDTFLQHLGPKAQNNIAGITPKDIETFRDYQIRQGKSPATANMEVKTLRVPFNLARRQGLILTNPAEAVELLPAETASRDVFTREQLGALLKVADVEWRGMILVGCTLGCRLGDAVRLTWVNIDLIKKTIRYFPQKTVRSSKKKPVEAIILPDLEKYLLELPVKSKAPDAPLFPSLSPKHVGGKHGLSLVFRRLMDKAGIESVPLRENLKGKGRQFYSLGFHALRKSFVSTLANMGVSSEIRKKLVGHASDEVHAVYTKLETETLRNALEGFPSLLSE